MKTLNVKLFASLLLAATFLFACEDDDPTTETLAFEADFYTLLTGFEEDGACSAPGTLLNTQEGQGSANLIGEFTTTITFCVDPATLIYFNGVGSFVGTDGDVIYFKGDGQILPSDKEGYELEFFDTFTITGGEGQFEGATGTMVTDSYVDSDTQQTDHIWSGEITIVK